MKWLKTSLLFFPLFISVLGFFGLSENVSAASLSTSGFDLYYTTDAGILPYSWRTGILYNSNPTVIDSDGGIQKYQFYTPAVTAGGNYGTIHFETNIVATVPDYSSVVNPWVNLSEQIVLTCNTNQGTSVIAKNLSYAITPWFSGSDSNSTITFYGDVVMSGFNMGSGYSFTCAIGSNSYSFIDPPFSVGVWFEQNPATIEWSNNQSDALMLQQINQNTTIINQNEQLIDAQEATNDWLTDDTAPSADTSSLGNAAGWLPPGPLDSVLNLPVQFIQGIIGVFTNTNTCSPIVLPLGIIDYDLEIPCMRPFFEFASVNIVWNTVGTIISAILIFNTLKWVYKFVDDTLSFRENNSTMWGGL